MPGIQDLFDLRTKQNMIAKDHGFVNNRYIDSYLYNDYNMDIDSNLYLLQKDFGGFYEV